MARKSKDVKYTPAGKDDMFKIVGLDIKNIIELGKDKLKVDNNVKVSDLSIELTEGMIIKAYDGGKAVELER